MYKKCYIIFVIILCVEHVVIQNLLLNCCFCKIIQNKIRTVSSKNEIKKKIVIRYVHLKTVRIHLIWHKHVALKQNKINKTQMDKETWELITVSTLILPTICEGQNRHNTENTKEALHLANIQCAQKKISWFLKNSKNLIHLEGQVCVPETVQKLQVMLYWPL